MKHTPLHEGESPITVEQQPRADSGRTAARLLSALSKYIAIPKEGTTYSTHGIHPYPAKFIPQIPARIISDCSNERHTILDPFCGSGTALLEARRRGRDSIGFDINPIAVLISKVKTTTLSKEELHAIDLTCSRIASKFRSNDYSEIWMPDIPRMKHWFRDDISKDLGLIAGELRRLDDPKVKNLLEVALSSVIVQVSNQQSETRFAAVNKKLKPNAVRSSFMRKVRTIVERVSSLALMPEVQRSATRVFLADARKMSQYIPERSADLVVTSPPYLNSYDYYLYHKFRIYWLGFDRLIPSPEIVRQMEIGSRFEYSGPRGASVDKFRREIKECFAELGRVTRLGKLLFVLVGDSVVRGEFIKMDVLYQDISDELGLHLVAKTSYPLKDVTRSFKAQATRTGRDSIKLQHILVFQNRSTSTSCVNATNSQSIADLKVDTVPEHVAPGTTLLITNNKVSGYTHAMIKYPSKFIPDIPKWAIRSYSSPDDLVFDPFVGCGTTMVEARLLGRNCIGLDINPFAVMASNVKANPIDRITLENALQRILRRIDKPSDVDLPQFPLRDFWFGKSVLEKLIKLRNAISQEDDESVRGFFLVTLGAIIKRCSYLDESQIKVERDQRKLLEGVPDPIQMFRRKSVYNVDLMETFYKDALFDTFAFAVQCDSAATPDSVVWKGKRYLTQGCDLVVTSPPYINAINYPMFNRYELLLLGLLDYDDYVPHQRFYLGTERVYAQEYSDDSDFVLDNDSFTELNQTLQKIRLLEPKRAYIVKRYFEGMARSISEIYRLLRNDGVFVFVVGSNTIKGVPIETSDILRRCAEEAGFSTLNSFSYRIRNHRFKITRHETGRQIDIDNVVVMNKG